MQGNTLITCDRCGWSHPTQRWTWTPPSAREEWARVCGIIAPTDNPGSFTGTQALCPTCQKVQP